MAEVVVLQCSISQLLFKGLNGITIRTCDFIDFFIIRWVLLLLFLAFCCCFLKLPIKLGSPPPPAYCTLSQIVHLRY